LKQTTRTFVSEIDFITSVGFGDGPGSREKNGLIGGGPRYVITDLGILEPDPESKELVLTSIHPGVTLEQIRENTGWDLKVAANLVTTTAPTSGELERVRALVATSSRKKS